MASCCNQPIAPVWSRCSLGVTQEEHEWVPSATPGVGGFPGPVGVGVARTSQGLVGALWHQDPAATSPTERHPGWMVEMRRMGIGVGRGESSGSEEFSSKGSERLWNQ